MNQTLQIYTLEFQRIRIHLFNWINKKKSFIITTDLFIRDYLK